MPEEPCEKTDNKELSECSLCGANYSQSEFASFDIYEYLYNLSDYDCELFNDFLHYELKKNYPTGSLGLYEADEVLCPNCISKKKEHLLRIYQSCKELTDSALKRMESVTICDNILLDVESENSLTDITSDYCSSECDTIKLLRLYAASEGYSEVFNVTTESSDDNLSFRASGQCYAQV